MTSNSEMSFDAIVVGGGPGGSTAASFIAKNGGRVLLLEREHFPRHQIGESLMASTVQGICRSLGVLDEIDQAGFIRKPAGIFRWGEGSDLWALAFTQAQQLTSKQMNYAFHVERAKFDEILLNNARKLGVVVREEATVGEAIVRDGRIAGVTYSLKNGAAQTATARFVVDASGGSSRLFTLVGQRVFSKFFRNIALFCYYQDADRLPPPFEGGGISEAFSHGWMWFLPITSKLTSVGAVIGAEHGSYLEGDRASSMRRFLEACPQINRLLEPATRVAEGPYSQFRVRKDFSYTNQKFWRPGLALVGDAACFLDPLFTTGVHFATYSGLLAARSINSVLNGVVDETSAFEEFEFRYRLEFELFYHYLIAYYDMNQDDSGQFWSTRKVGRSPESQNTEFIRLLTRGMDSPEEYFASKIGIGRRTQEFVHQVKQSKDTEERIQVSRTMAEAIYFEFQPKSGARPFHVGFEDLRRTSWGDERDPTTEVVSERRMIPSTDGLSWQRAS
jgi:halogenation protein CepH